MVKDFWLWKFLLQWEKIVKPDFLMFKDLTDEELPDHDIYYQDDISIIHAMDDSIDIGLE